MPSVRTLSSTIFTLSGCWRAFSSHPERPNSTSIRSVPVDSRLRVVRMSRWPRVGDGAGTSTTCVAPSRRLCNTCFMLSGGARRVALESQRRLLDDLPGQYRERADDHERGEQPADPGNSVKEQQVDHRHVVNVNAV